MQFLARRYLLRVLSARAYIPTWQRRMLHILLSFYSITGILPSNTKDHASQMDEVTASVICYADTYNSVQDLAEKVRAALDGKTRGTYGGVSLQSIRITDQISTQMNIDKLVYIVDQTYQIRQNR
jgi:hypothetical protein